MSRKSVGESSRRDDREKRSKMEEKKIHLRWCVLSAMYNRELLPRDRFNWYGSASNGLTTIRWNRLCLARGHAARLVSLSCVHSLDASNENGGAYTGNLCSAKVGSPNLVTSSATKRYKSTRTGCPCRISGLLLAIKLRHYVEPGVSNCLIVLFLNYLDNYNSRKEIT